MLMVYSRERLCLWEKTEALPVLTPQTFPPYTHTMNTESKTSESTLVHVLHAGALTTLVREQLAPALSQAHGITLKSQPGHSVALALAIKEQRLHGDLY